MANEQTTAVNSASASLSSFSISKNSKGRTWDIKIYARSNSDEDLKAAYQATLDYDAAYSEKLDGLKVDQ